MNTRAETNILTAQLTIEAHLRGIENTDLPEATAMLDRALYALRSQDATPFIPGHITDVTFSRSPTLEGDMRVQANGPGWSISFWTTEDDALSDLADMCAQIVAKKEKRT